MASSTATRTLAAVILFAFPSTQLASETTYRPDENGSQTIDLSEEPVTAAAVELAIEEYVRAKYAGDDEAVRDRAHHDIARRTVADSYWGQPSKEWVRPFGHDNLQFYGSKYSTTTLDNPLRGRCDITVFDVAQRSASAMIVMEDVVDYLHMIHFDGKWLIGDSAVIILENQGDRAPVERPTKHDEIAEVVRDYCMGFYEIDGDKVQNTCHPILSKRTIEHAEGTDFDYLSSITWEEIKLLGETFNKHYRLDPETARCELDVYEVRGNVAAAKLTGATWFDYFHLLRVNGEWTIVNIIYEALPRDEWEGVD